LIFRNSASIRRPLPMRLHPRAADEELY